MVLVDTPGLFGHEEKVGEESKSAKFPKRRSSCESRVSNDNELAVELLGRLHLGTARDQARCSAGTMARVMVTIEPTVLISVDAAASSA
jgi:hypothetical protein